MFEPPRLMPTRCTDEQHAGVTYHIQGPLDPALIVEITPDQPIYFEHDIVNWKHPTVTVGLRPMKGLWRRLMAGMQFFLTEARGHGMIAFSRNGIGQVFPILLEEGQAVDVRQHQFLAATKDVDYGFKLVRGFLNLVLGQNGVFMATFNAKTGPGILWLHGAGNVSEKTLAAGESVDIEPGGWVYQDAGVQMSTVYARFINTLFGRSSIIMNRMTGPGRVGIQTLTGAFVNDT
jgi:uncharacterized protein (AIM24 family)